MRKSYTYRRAALRFRRWSRKAYAAFISIQRAVTIGQLSFSVADRFQKKNQSLHTGFGTLMDGSLVTDEEEGQENAAGNEWSLALSPVLSAAMLPLQVSNEIAHPAYRVALYYNDARKAVSIRRDIYRLSYFHSIVYLPDADDAEHTARRRFIFLLIFIVCLPLRGTRPEKHISPLDNEYSIYII